MMSWSLPTTGSVRWSRAPSTEHKTTNQANIPPHVNFRARRGAWPGKRACASRVRDRPYRDVPLATKACAATDWFLTREKRTRWASILIYMHTGGETAFDHLAKQDLTWLPCMLALVTTRAIKQQQPTRGGRCSPNLQAGENMCRP